MDALRAENRRLRREVGDREAPSEIPATAFKDAEAFASFGLAGGLTP